MIHRPASAPLGTALLWALLGAAIGLRLLLVWLNPPANAFDDHFEPIALILRTGAVAAKDACFQCYHPPVYYALSAALGKLALALGAGPEHLPKVAQLVSCACGILTLLLVLLILRRLPLSRFAVLLAFGTVCFLPRHIYLSAMLSNDTIAQLGVAGCVYLLLVALQRQLGTRWLVLLSIALALTMFTKYNAFIALPTVAGVFSLAYLWRVPAPRQRIVRGATVVLVPALLLLGVYFIDNLSRYQTPLPWNLSILDPGQTQPHAPGGVSFLTFKPWTIIRQPILWPDNLDSFWTLIHGRLWFDMEPKFLYFTDPDRWWLDYYAWLRGERPLPTPPDPVSTSTRAAGRALIAGGLLPLTLMGIGAFLCMARAFATRSAANRLQAILFSAFPVLFVLNAAGIIALAWRLPVFTAMKASYFLTSLPAFAVFLGLGAARCEQWQGARATLGTLFGLLFALVATHTLRIAAALSTLAQGP